MREIDRAVSSDVEIVRATERNSFGFRANHCDISISGNRKQTLDGVSDDQVSATIEDKPQGTPSGVGNNLWLLAVRLETKDAAVVSSAIDSILRIEGHVFGPVAVNV